MVCEGGFENFHSKIRAVKETHFTDVAEQGEVADPGKLGGRDRVMERLPHLGQALALAGRQLRQGGIPKRQVKSNKIPALLLDTDPDGGDGMMACPTSGRRWHWAGRQLRQGGIPKRQVKSNKIPALLL